MTKIKNNFSIFTLFFLTIFLPFYALIRAYLLYKNISILSSSINHIRDSIILSSFIYTILKYKKSKTTVKSYLELGIIILLINYMYGFLISTVNGYVLLGLKSIHLNVIPILIVYIIIKEEKINYDWISKYLEFLIRVTLLVSIIGIYFYLIRPNIFGQLLLIFSKKDEANFDQVLNYSRMVSTFLSPNVFGTYMAISILIVINKIINNVNKKNKIKDFVLFIIFTFCLILSFSRGAWLFTFVGTLVVIFTSRAKLVIKSIKYILILILILPVVFVLLPYINENLYVYICDRFISIFDFGNHSSYGRISSWVDVLVALKRNIFGYGLGIASINLLAYPELVEKIGIDVIDGYYIKLMAETGIIGIILFSLFSFFFIRNSLFLIGTKKNKEVYVYRLTLAIFIGFLVQSFGSNTFDYVNIAPFLWIFVGFTLKLRNSQNKIIK